MLDCKHLRRVLGGVLEGETDGEVLVHLSTCTRCRLLVEELGAITRAARQLPTQEPSPGLWKRIRRAAEAEGLLQPSWASLLGRRLGLLEPVPLTPAFSAALVVLLVAAALLVGYPSLDLRLPGEQPPTRVEIARSELALAPNYGERYALHLADLEATMTQELGTANPQMTRLAQTNLDTLDRFIDQCHVQLVNYPDDELTRSELNRLYQQKTALLQAMLDPDWQTSVR